MKIIAENQNLITLKDNRLAPQIAGVVVSIIGILIIFKVSFINTLSIWYGLGFLALGSVVFLFWPTMIINMDKSFNKLSVSKKSLVLKEYNEYTLDQIKEINFKEKTTNQIQSGRVNTKIEYRIFINLQNNESLQLPDVWTKGREEKGRILARKLATFLNIPFNEAGSPNTMQDIVMSTIQKITQGNPDKNKDIK